MELIHIYLKMHPAKTYPNSHSRDVMGTLTNWGMNRMANILSLIFKSKFVA